MRGPDGHSVQPLSVPRVAESHSPPGTLQPRTFRTTRFSMTTNTITHPESNHISWPPLLWIGGLHAGALLAFWPGYFTWSALAMCLFLHWVTGGIGICMTYHRLLTHRSFATRPKWLEYVLTAIGCCA